MAIGVRRLAQPIDVKEALEASGLFARVEQPTANNWPVDCYDENDTLIVEFKWYSSAHRIYFYYNNGSSATSNVTYYSSFDVAYYTPHGIMLKCSGGGSNPVTYAVILTKDNNGEITFIYNPSSSDEQYVAIRRSYSGSLTAQSYTAVTSSQTALVPFVNLINDGDGRSFTPAAFWIPISENYNLGFCAITINGIQYITNGHYALKDAEIVL